MIVGQLLTEGDAVAAFKREIEAFPKSFWPHLYLEMIHVRTLALTWSGRPRWDQQDFDWFIGDLACAGYGWLAYTRNWKRWRPHGRRCLCHGRQNSASI